MDISIGFLKTEGFKKIASIYKEELNNIEKTKFDNKISLYVIVGSWGSTFKSTKLEVCNKFTEWCRLYYPEIDTLSSEVDRVRLFKSSKKLRADFLEATSIDLKSSIANLPVNEITSIIDNKTLTKEESDLCKALNSILSFSILCVKFQKSHERTDFEDILRLLMLDSKEFIERLNS